MGHGVLPAPDGPMGASAEGPDRSTRELQPRKRSHIWDFCRDQDTLPQENCATFFQTLIKLNP